MREIGTAMGGIDMAKVSFTQKLAQNRGVQVLGISASCVSLAGGAAQAVPVTVCDTIQNQTASVEGQPGTPMAQGYPIGFTVTNNTESDASSITFRLAISPYETSAGAALSDWHARVYSSMSDMLSGGNPFPAPAGGDIALTNVIKVPSFSAANMDGGAIYLYEFQLQRVLPKGETIAIALEHRNNGSDPYVIKSTLPFPSEVSTASYVPNRPQGPWYTYNVPGGHTDSWLKFGMTTIIDQEPMTIPSIKKCTSSAKVALSGARVSRISGTEAYVQDETVPSGIRVTSPDGFGSAVAGSKVEMAGVLGIDQNGECYIQLANSSSISVDPASPVAVKPLAMNSKALGGGTFGSQVGPDGGNGLNTVGMLARVAARVDSVNGDGSYVITDGGDSILCFNKAGITVPTEGNMIIATGVSSLKKLPGGSTVKTLKEATYTVAD